MTLPQEKQVQITNYAIIKVKCQKCGHEWYPRKEKRPQLCPNCKCLKWDNYQPQKKKAKQVL